MSLHTRLQHSVEAACEHGAMCVHDRAGHGLGALQHRLAHATPSGWLDAIVESADADGWLTLRAWVSDEVVRVWNHADLSDTLPTGTPVVLHARYNVLLAAGAAFNVAR